MKKVKWSTELVEMFDISVRSIKLGIIKSACTHNFVPSFQLPLNLTLKFEMFASHIVCSLLSSDMYSHEVSTSRPINSSF